MTTPTIEQLAHLAATLADGANDKPDRLASGAFALWQACETKLAAEAERQTALDASRAEAAALPRPKKYPLSRDEFVKLFLPRDKASRTAEVADAAKAYALSFLKFENERLGKPAPTQDDVRRFYADWKDTDEFSFPIFARQFQRWLNGYRAKQIHAARKHAAKASVEKRAANAEAAAKLKATKAKRKNN